MFLYKLFILILIIVDIHSSPFPDQMLYSEDEITVLYNPQTLGYQTTQIPKPQQVSRLIPFHTLMPQACKFSEIDSVSRFPQCGLVGFQSKTYKQRYFPNGRYYKTIREYDQHCTCPYTRQIFWNPENNWTTIQSGEALNKNNRIEVITFKTHRKMRYQIPNDVTQNPHERIRISAIESIYLKDVVFNNCIYNCRIL